MHGSRMGAAALSYVANGRVCTSHANMAVSWRAARWHVETGCARFSAEGVPWTRGGHLLDSAGRCLVLRERLVYDGICRRVEIFELDNRHHTDARGLRGHRLPPADRGPCRIDGDVGDRCGRAAGPSVETFCICHSMRSCACRRATRAWRLGLWGRCGAPLAPILLHGGKGRSGLAAEYFGAVRHQSAGGRVCAARSVTPTFATECLSILCCFGLVCLHWGF